MFQKFDFLGGTLAPEGFVAMGKPAEAFDDDVVAMRVIVFVLIPQSSKQRQRPQLVGQSLRMLKGQKKERRDINLSTDMIASSNGLSGNIAGAAIIGESRPLAAT